MAIAFHVNGTATIALQTSGTGPPTTLTTVGFSESGVDIDFNFQWSDVNVDIYGPKVPADVQYFLQDAIISFPLVMYDNSIFNDFLAQMPGLTPGTMSAAGDLVIQNSNWFRLLIKSTPTSQGLTNNEEVCYNFIRTYPLSIRGRHGTVRKMYDCTFRALPYAAGITGGSSSGAVLWNNTCT